MKNKNIFDILLLLARPGAGKSEIIDYLKKIPLDERVERFHVGKMDEIDDFPMLWTWFEEDALLEKMGYPRLHTDQEGYFLGTHLWNLLVERIGLEYQKRQINIPEYKDTYTTIIEFSRGKEHGGYQAAFSHLSPQMIYKLSILYVDVTWEESLRKNRKRFNPDKPDSILEHSLPDYKLERLYKEEDWHEMTSDDSQYMIIQGIHVPYMNFDNSDDVTTQRGIALGNRLEDSLNTLWAKYKTLRDKRTA